MSDFNVRSDAINVDQVMDQIRARIQEKRGVDYTEQQIRELAAVKLEKFLDPRLVRSDLLEQFQKARPARTARIEFGPNTIFEAKRPIIQKIREWTRPILRLFFNPDPVAQGLMRLNDIDPKDDLYYELFHNLVLELTRTGIEVKNLKMRVESLTGRLEFNERRARALESVVVYKPEESARAAASTSSDLVHRPARETSSPAPTPAQPQQPQPQTPAPSSGEGPGQRSRRRRRRRGRRSGSSAAAVMNPDTQGRPPEASSAAEASAPRDSVPTSPGSSLPNEPARAADPPAPRESTSGGSDDDQ
jgi:hypothetical protein